MIMNTIKKISTATVALAVSPLSVFAASVDTGGTTLQNPLGGVSDFQSLLNLVLTKIVIPLGAILCALVIIYSGFLFVTARGEEGKIETAKKTFFYAVIGTLVLLGAATIAGIIQSTIKQVTG